jgi:hypothetical protein
MTQTLMRTLAPAMFGAIAATSFLMPQAAQAGVVKASGIVDFTSVSLILDPINPATASTNLFLGGSFSTNASSSLVSLGVPQISGPIFSGPTTAPGAISLTADPGALTNGLGSPSTADSFGSVGSTGGANGTASTLLSSDLVLQNGFSSAESASNTSNEQIFSPTFSALDGDTINLSGFLDYILKVSIVGFDPGDTKTASSQFNASYAIERLGPGGGILQQINLADARALINENGDVTIDPANTAFADIFEIEVDGTYRVTFNSNLTTQGRNEQFTTVPEPSAVLGLAGVALVGILARKRRG